MTGAVFKTVCGAVLPSWVGSIPMSLRQLFAGTFVWSSLRRLTESPRSVAMLCASWCRSAGLNSPPGWREAFPIDLSRLAATPSWWVPSVDSSGTPDHGPPAAARECCDTACQQQTFTMDTSPNRGNGGPVVDFGLAEGVARLCRRCGQLPWSRECVFLGYQPRRRV